MQHQIESPSLFEQAPHEKEAVSSEETNSSFKIYSDGIGFKGYSLRLSNCSFTNMSTNLIRCATWTAALGVAMGRPLRAQSIGLTAYNEITHYLIKVNPYTDFKLQGILPSVSNGLCNVIYDPSRQDEYSNMDCKRIYSLPTNWQYDYHLELCRGYLQPVLTATEECLKKLINETYEEQQTVYQKQLDSSLKFLDTGINIALATFGLFSLGYTGYQAHQLYQRRNRPSSNPLHIKHLLEQYEDIIDNELLCPITKQIMDDPVRTNDGFTYDREAIEAWYLQGNRRSPMIPSKKLDWNEIKPNEELRKKIIAFAKERSIEYTPSRIKNS